MLSQVSEKKGSYRTELFVPIRKEVARFNQDGTQRDQRFYLADVEAFVAPIAVIPNIDGPPNEYFLVKNKTEWQELYLEWLNEDFDLEEATSDDL